MISYDFTKHAEKAFLKLPSDIQTRIIHKLESYLSAPVPLAFARRLAGTTQSWFRFRVGDYRIIFEWEGDKILILQAGHRRDIYQS